MPEHAIGIFAAEKRDENGNPVSFFELDDNSLLAALYQHASKIVGPGLTKYDPADGEEVRRVAKVVVQSVDDDDTPYMVKAEDTEKPEGGRVPDADTGEWLIQSLIFSKDNFDEASARKWVADHDGFGDFGIDETSTSYRFRQYDPTYFSEFRIVPMADGLSAVYGKVAEKENEDSEKALKAALANYNAVRDINKGIIERGLRVLACQNHQMTKADGEGVEEERFVLSMVLEPNDGQDGAPYNPDTQKDIYSEADIRMACHTWSENGGMIDLMHNWKALGRDTVCPVETYIAPVEFEIGDDNEKVLKGSWMLGARIYDDDLWEAAKEGNLGAWSIGGTANRTPAEAGGKS